MKVDLKKVFIEALKPENHLSKELLYSFEAKVGIFKVKLKNGHSIYLRGYKDETILDYINMKQKLPPSEWLELVNLFDQSGVDKKPVNEAEQELIELFGEKIISHEN